MNKNFYCKECGHWGTPHRYGDNNLCFTCNIWTDRSNKYTQGNSNMLIIEGKLYTDAGRTNPDDTAFNGHSGREFYIIMLDGSRQWLTNNLWCGGDIPNKYQETTMKDNAKFI